MNVLSLFDGMSCGQIALNKAGVSYGSYYSSEIDRYAIEVTQKNYPDTIQLGDITNWREWDVNWGEIGLVLAGSPCQGFSFAGKQLAFDDPRSKLFFTFVDICNHIAGFKPKMKFLLENVKMKKEYLDIISRYMGVEPVLINSSLVSAQRRERYYWTNIDIKDEIVDKGIFVRDIIDYSTKHKQLSEKAIAKHLSYKRGYKPTGKSPTLTTELAHGTGKNVTPKCHFEIKAVTREDRVFSPLECERLQTVPDEYTSCVSNTQRYKMLGNGWTVDVIAHILNHINK